MNWHLSALSVLVVALVACDKQSEIKVYRVSKASLEDTGSEQQNAMPANAPSPAMPGGMAPMGLPQNSNASRLKWETPEGWTEVPSSAMRYASFTAGSNRDKIDISVVTFQGEGGSNVDNVNRWRQQLGLPPMSEAAIATQITSLKSADSSFAVVDIAGANASTLAAWTRRDGQVWFFKATGPSIAVEKEKQNFVKFVQSVRF
jgi:hypothetical protein